PQRRLITITTYLPNSFHVIPHLHSFPTRRSSDLTSIQPEVHSTDTHGTNEVNFAILHFFGYQFAPRYKDIYDTVNNSLYGFKHPDRKSTRLNSSHVSSSYAVFCLNKNTCSTQCGQ